MTKSICRYWGKAEKDGEGYHILPYHCLDVAAVGHLLMTDNASLRKRFAAITGLDEEVCCRWLKLFLTLHDLGKFSESFQNLRPDLLEKLQGKTSTKNYSVRHDGLGNLLWRDHLWDALESDDIPAFPEMGNEMGEWQDVFSGIIKAFAGHHGKPPDLSGQNNIRLYLASYFGHDDFMAADEFIRDLITVFPLMSEGAALPSPYDLEEGILKASWLMAGFVVLCDWIGSNSDWFAYVEKPMSLTDYWQNHALPQAERALREAGIGKPTAVNDETTFSRLFPAISHPTPLQRHVADCSIAADPQMFILEDVTGSGKTEAALMLVERLMAAGCGSGFFVALPTMATSNAMYGRMTSVYRKLFADEATPSLVLAHAARHLSASFMASVAGPSKYASEDEAATAQCSSWLADNRKKALLADVGVGTIDQAFTGHSSCPLPVSAPLWPIRSYPDC